MALGKKTGGRKAGTPNKKTLIFQEQLTSLKFDLVAEIVNVVRGGQLSDAEKANILLKLLEYQLPKRKPVEVPEDDALDVTPGDDLSSVDTQSLLKQIK